MDKAVILEGCVYNIFCTHVQSFLCLGILCFPIIPFPYSFPLYLSGYWGDHELCDYN